MLNWHWWQWTMAIVISLGLLNEAIRHGKPREGTHSFPMAMMSALIFGVLLREGGFWS